MQKKLPKRKCKNCHDVFQKVRSLQMCCSYRCAVLYAKTVRTKREASDWKKEKKVLKEKLKTKSDYEKELETIFNAFIRERDKDMPCISCDAPPGTYKLTAGHYFPQGSNKSVRFNEDNVHSQCWFNCNKNQHGNLSEYLPRVIKKIGQDRWDEVARAKNTPAHYSIPELIQMKIEYKEKLRKLKL